MDLIEEEINKLKTQISRWEDTDPLYVDDEIKTLRHMVGYVHAVAERELYRLICNYLLDWDKKKQDVAETALFYFKISPILDRFTFANRVDFCTSNKIIDKQLSEQLKSVNKIRNTFSHPTNYKMNISQFRERKTYLDTLKKLCDACDSINRNITAKQVKAT